MKNSVKVAVLQSRPLKKLEANLNQVQQLLIESARQEARIVVLPENFAYYGEQDLQSIGCQEAQDSGPVRQFLSEQAKRLKLWIVGGTVPAGNQQTKPVARSLVYDPSGLCVDHYDKIHLFDADVHSETSQQVYRESDLYGYGKTVKTVDTDFCKLGLSVCYDLRFAALYNQLRALGSQIVAVPAAFTAITGRDHWQLLLRARAVENQFFMVGANLVDRASNSRGLWGGSAIIDPWGTVIGQMDDEIGVVTADVNLNMMDDIRARMPVQHHARLLFKN
ncbi:MAG: carbon-nitrogen hydrolase family protein [Porticoccaceae bacterium]|nr:carbon-nitrogen hydrolase family protein [Porticoccaceae bacterium]